MTQQLALPFTKKMFSFLAQNLQMNISKYIDLKIIFCVRLEVENQKYEINLTVMAT